MTRVDLPTVLPNAIFVFFHHKRQIRKGQRGDDQIDLSTVHVAVREKGHVSDTSVRLTFIASCSPLGKKPLEMVSSA